MSDKPQGLDGELGAGKQAALPITGSGSDVGYKFTSFLANMFLLALLGRPGICLNLLFEQCKKKKKN